MKDRGSSVDETKVKPLCWRARVPARRNDRKQIDLLMRSRGPEIPGLSSLVLPSLVEGVHHRGTQIVPRGALIDGGRSTGAAR